MAYIARNRLALVHCDSHCPIVPQGNSGSEAIFQADHWLPAVPLRIVHLWFLRCDGDLFCLHARVLPADRMAPVCKIKFLGEGDLS